MNELEIKMSLINYLSTEHPKETGTKFIKELFVENFARRADVVMVNGHLSAYEIKSDLDSLLRLEGQLDSFTRYFEYVTVVCTKTHLNKVKAILSRDEWLKVGIFLVNGEKVRSVRKPKKNVLRIDYWFSHLPVDELRKILKENAIPAKGNRAELINVACEHLSVKHVREFVLQYFKRRDTKIQIMKKRSNQPENRLHQSSILDDWIKSHRNILQLGSINVIPRRVK